MKKPFIKVSDYKLTFNKEFSNKFINGKTKVNIVDNGDKYLIGFCNEEREVPLQLRDEIVEVKHNEADGHYIPGARFSEMYGNGYLNFVEKVIGAERATYFELTK